MRRPNTATWPSALLAIFTGAGIATGTMYGHLVPTAAQAVWHALGGLL
ncbi:MAG: hypothetical protein LW854_08740 [Rubrivivax sp.]|jgi:hypothetical protein|nr:hypothetical protein [Rubrivivax sp.]